MADWRSDRCRASYAAWGAGHIEALVSLWDPDCEWDLGSTAAVGMGPTYHGHSGLREMMREMTEAFPDFAPRIIELRRLGEQLLVRGDAGGTSRLMGVETAMAPFGQVIEFSGGRISRVLNTEDPPPNWDDAQPVD